MRLALIHSPLVGPSAWRLAAAALEASGVRAIAVDYGGVSGPDWYGGAAARIAEVLAPEPPLVLAVHSGAGSFVPSLARSLRTRVAGFLFVDALMPHPGKRWLDTAPPALAHRALAIAEAGVLPPWDAWFSRGALAALIPDSSQLAMFRTELPRVPLAYLEAVAPAGDGWRTSPCGYLQLSEAYATEADQAAALGWIVRRAPLHHLAMLTHPDTVAAIVAEMAHELANA